jgi:hypothetical protein
MIPNKSLFKNTNKETVTIKDKTEWTINHLWTKLKENALNKSIEYSKFSTLLVDGKFEPQCVPLSGQVMHGGLLRLRFSAISYLNIKCK